MVSFAAVSSWINKLKKINRKLPSIYFNFKEKYNRATYRYFILMLCHCFWWVFTNQNSGIGNWYRYLGLLKRTRASIALKKHHCSLNFFFFVSMSDTINVTWFSQFSPQKCSNRGRSDCAPQSPLGCTGWFSCLTCCIQFVFCHMQNNTGDLCCYFTVFPSEILGAVPGKHVWISSGYNLFPYCGCRSHELRVKSETNTVLLFI